MILFTLLFIFSGIHCSQSNPYKNFATNSHGIIEKEDLGFVIAAHQAPDDSIIAIYSQGSILKFNTSGIQTSILTLGQEITSAYFENDRFIVSLSYQNGGSTENKLVRVKYDLSLDSSFGNNGTTQVFTDRNNDIRFNTITKQNNLYYVGGDSSHNDIDNPIVFRYTNSGSLDLSFHEVGYTVLDSLGSGEVDTILFLKNNAIVKNYSGLIQASTQTITTLKSISQLFSSNIEAYDDTSFFVCYRNTVYKYTDSLVLDTTFNNGLGSITFDKIATLFPNESNTYPLTFIRKVGNYLICSGYTFKSDGGNNYNQIPYFVCYNISNPANPYLEPTFFNGGYFTGLTTDYPLCIHSNTSTFVTPNSVPYLFLTSDRYLTCFPLGEGFSKKISTENSLFSYLTLEEAYGNYTPFLN